MRNGINTGRMLKYNMSEKLGKIIMIMNTIKVPSIRTDRSEQTVQT